MSEIATSPRILRHAWGRLEVEGHDVPFKDAKLYPGGARAWDWGESGTRHSPGIQPEDVEELLERGATVVVIGKGVLGRLQVDPATLRMLEGRSVTVHVRHTKAAVRLYNELRLRHTVGALIHTTC